MSLTGTLLNTVARTLRPRQSRLDLEHAGKPRILVIRRNRIGDMIYTLPLLHALRRHQSAAHISVACDPAAAPIAEACPAVNDIIVLAETWSSWVAAYKNAVALQGYDWVIAAKGGYDRRLARLARLTNAPVRIGFEKTRSGTSNYYTNPVPLPEDPHNEHQIDTLLRLLKPVGLVKPTAFSVNLSLRVPDASRDFAAEVLSRPPFSDAPSFMLINFSSTVKLRFREEDFIALCRRILGSTGMAIGLVAAPVDQQVSHEVAMCMASTRIAAIDTPGPMDLAALLERAVLLFTPEGGAAHLAAAMGTPALVLWSEGPFGKWHSRGRRHEYVRAEPAEKVVPLERVWAAMQPMLNLRADGLEQSLDNQTDPFRLPDATS